MQCVGVVAELTGHGAGVGAGGRQGLDIAGVSPYIFVSAGLYGFFVVRPLTDGKIQGYNAVAALRGQEFFHIFTTLIVGIVAPSVTVAGVDAEAHIGWFVDGDVVDGGDGTCVEVNGIGLTDRVAGGFRKDSVGVAGDNHHSTGGSVNADGIRLFYGQFQTHHFAAIGDFGRHFHKVDASGGVIYRESPVVIALTSAHYVGHHVGVGLGNGEVGHRFGLEVADFHLVQIGSSGVEGKIEIVVIVGEGHIPPVAVAASDGLGFQRGAFCQVVFFRQRHIGHVRGPGAGGAVAGHHEADAGDDASNGTGIVHARAGGVHLHGIIVGVKVAVAF